MRSEKGQAAVEFALVLPFLILLICGIIDFGRVLYTANALTGTCERAARYASINPSVASDDLFTYTKDNYVPAGIDKEKIAWDPVSPSGIPRGSGANVVVSFNYEMNYITPFVDLIKLFTSESSISSVKTLHFTATCRGE